jgi:RNA polymerase sigma factor (sigma-70 family)
VNLDRADLIERVTLYAPLVSPIVTSIIRLHNWARLDWPDLMQAGFLGLLEACHHYNPERSSFSTYATKRIEWAVLGAIKENHPAHQRLIEDLDLPERADPAPGPDRALELREILDSLTPQQRRVIELRLSGCSQAMIASELAISRVAVTRLEQRALQHLRQRRDRPVRRAA